MGGASQAPPRHAPEGHTLSQRPQLRASLSVSTQLPPQQLRPAPVQLPPAQHASPTRVPQVATGLAHSPDWQVSPPVQSAPEVQHASPSPPQAAARAWQVPPTQSKAVSQRTPPQQV